MAYSTDLDTTTQVARGPHVRAIGWLSRDRPFPAGDAPDAFVRRLRSFCALCFESSSSLRWPGMGGTHPCGFCNAFRTSGNLGVPAGPVLFVAPEMVGHYVQRHRYLPPPDFIAAVLAAPLPGTAEYDQAVAPFVAHPPSDVPGTPWKPD